jgi:hypothetical protein
MQRVALRVKAECRIASSVLQRANVVSTQNRVQLMERPELESGDKPTASAA